MRFCPTGMGALKVLGGQNILACEVGMPTISEISLRDLGMEPVTRHLKPTLLITPDTV